MTAPTTLSLFDGHNLVAQCDVPGDGSLKNCKLEPGATITDALGPMFKAVLDSEKEQQAAEAEREALRQFCVDQLESDLKAFKKIGKTLKGIGTGADKPQKQSANLKGAGVQR